MGRGVPQGLQAGLPSLGCYVDSPAGDLMAFGSTGQGSPGGYIENMLSNEQNPSRQDYQPFWLSQVRTITYGPVRKNSDGLFYTTETSFNLE